MQPTESQVTPLVDPPVTLAVREYGDRGLDLSTMDEATRDQILTMVVWGDADEVGEKMSAVLATGVDGFTVSLPGSGHIPERVEQLGATALKVLG